ncbi:hypothetical protein [Pengzhenrongella sp.]|uniref:hypothetical protein n=1 Tax=Pengzhenrongella sp. TaxID=2888820 RepID=UPI0039C96695
MLELGDVPTGAVAGRENAHQFTVFKSAGSAVLDGVTAHKVYPADLTQGGSDQVWEGCVRGTHRFFRILSHRTPIGHTSGWRQSGLGRICARDALILPERSPARAHLRGFGLARVGWRNARSGSGGGVEDVQGYQGAQGDVGVGELAG